MEDGPPADQFDAVESPEPDAVAPVTSPREQQVPCADGVYVQDATAAAGERARRAQRAGRAEQADQADQAGSTGAEEDDEIAATVEAVVFASDTPLTAARIAQVAEIPLRQVKRAVERLNAKYDQGRSAFRVETIAGGYQMLTLPEYHDVLGRLLRVRSESRLTQAALETLAIVAYRQPVLRADVEAIRGVACGEVLRGLMEKNLIKIVGRAEVLGRPMLYGTTRRFLEVFGLANLEDLPKVEELRSGARDARRPPQAQAEPAKADQPAQGHAPQAEATPAPPQDGQGEPPADQSPQSQ